MSRLDEIEARTEERRKHSPLAMEMAADIDDLLNVARAAEELLASAENYATEAKAFAKMSQENRTKRLLLRFVQGPGVPPKDYFVFEAEDFLSWFGRDGE